MIPEHPHRSEVLAAKSQTSCRLALPYRLALFQEEGTGLSPCRDFRKPQNASGSASPHSSVAVLSPKDETHSSVLSSIDPTFLPLERLLPTASAPVPSASKGHLL